MKVLIVDDDEITLDLISSLVTGAGYETVQANNGRLGLEQYGQCQPDIVLTDIQMPEMSGLDLLREIRDERADTIVIIMTAHGNEQYALEALRSKANDYLKKPINAKELLLTLEKYAEALKHTWQVSEVPKFITRSEMTMTIDNRLDMVQEVADYLVAQAGGVLAGQEAFGVRFGLVELITNAIEHGNLEISYDEKTKALGESFKAFKSLLTQRLSDPRFQGRRVTIKCVLNDKDCEWEIRDDGKGFDWRATSRVVEEESLMSLHGRGILLSHFQFDKMEYIGSGNVVRCRKRGSNESRP